MILRCRSVVSPFQVRFKSVPKNGTYMGGTREAQGSYIGLTWELRSFWGKVKILVLHVKKCLKVKKLFYLLIEEEKYNEK